MILTKIINGECPSIAEFNKEFSQFIPLLHDLEAYEMYEMWQYGDESLTHTDVVLREIYKLSNEEMLSIDEKVILFLAGAFHSVGKKYDQSENTLRVCSCDDETYSLLRGNLLCQLSESDLDNDLISEAANIIACQNRPFQLVDENSSDAKWFQLCREVNVKLLYHFLKADIRSHQDPEMEFMIETLDLFKMKLEEMKLWNNQAHYPEWFDFFSSNMSNGEREACLVSIHDFEKDVINSKEEGLARAYRFNNSFSELHIKIGINEPEEESEIIVLEDFIKSEGGRADNPKTIGRALQAAKASLKKYLADNKQVVWQAAHVSADLRKSIIRIAMNYNAFVSIKYCIKKATHCKPTDLSSFLIPSIKEAHELIFCDENGEEFFRSP